MRRKPKLVMIAGVYRIVRARYSGYVLERRSGTDCMDVQRWATIPPADVTTALLRDVVDAIGHRELRRQKRRRRQPRSGSDKAKEARL